ncbi:hypothetical protein BOW50_09080 [Solemya velum gill symbiont]|uniref:antirestriction protein ArdA n=1 Tax=Solemya velum gill symbiont TaxID=2340 RepID=UPI00099810A6|nr:antirestriction protein ArdA [Solemya velum gill symbiont]OOZ76873.1 hypothetical protein BOW50_09080 [Solemya velum gill symbiont]
MATIILYELSNYNNSRLVPHTFDLDGIDNNAWLEAVGEWLHNLTEISGQLCEEWIVCDYDDIPDGFIGEYDISNDYWNYKQAMEASYLNEEVFAAAAELGIAPDMVEELHQGKYDTDADFAYQMADELDLLPEGHEWPCSYIDWDAAAYDLMMDYGESCGHYFRTSY